MSPHISELPLKTAAVTRTIASLYSLSLGWHTIVAAGAASTQGWQFESHYCDLSSAWRTLRALAARHRALGWDAEGADAAVRAVSALRRSRT